MFTFLKTRPLALTIAISVGTIWCIAGSAIAFRGDRVAVHSAAAIIGMIVSVLMLLWVDWRTQAGRDAKSLLKPGIVVGHAGHSGYMVLGGHGHVLVDGPERSGKTAGIVVPTLLSWCWPAVVLTGRLEAVKMTAGWRSTLGPVYVFDPFGREPGPAHRYNPLDDIRNACAEDDLRAIGAELLADLPPGDVHRGGCDAITLFVALAMYLRGPQAAQQAERRAATIGEIRRLCVSRADVLTFEDWLRAELALSCDGESWGEVFRVFLHMAWDVRNAVRERLLMALEPWEDAQLDAATSASDFSLLDGRRMQTVYINMGPFTRRRNAPLARVMFSRLGARRASTQEPWTTREYLPCLAVLDNVIWLNRWHGFANWLGECGAGNVRVLTVVQNADQLGHLCGVGAGGARNFHTYIVRTRPKAGERPAHDGIWVSCRRWETESGEAPAARFDAIRYFSDPLFAVRAALSESPASPGQACEGADAAPSVAGGGSYGR